MEDKKKVSIRIVRKIFFAVLKTIFHYSKFYFFFVIITSIFLGALPTLSLIIMQKILNGLQLYDVSVKQLITYVLMYVGIEVFNVIINSIRGYYDSYSTLKINQKINQSILEKAALLELEDYEDSETYNNIIRAQNEANNTVTDYFMLIISILQNIIMSISQIILLIRFQWLLVFVICVIPIARYSVSIFFSKKQFDLMKSRTTEERKAWYISYLVTMGNAFKEIKVFNIKNIESEVLYEGKNME